jgi:hypothetical protein
MIARVTADGALGARLLSGVDLDRPEPFVQRLGRAPILVATGTAAAQHEGGSAS